MRGSEDRDRVPSKGNPVESKRKLPTVSVEWLENAAADLEVSANASRETWAVLGLSHRYSENIGRAHAMRHAARLKLEYDRRLFLRSIGLKV
ncbi:bacteriophage protein Gp49 [Burkholderia pseudomallei]|uniref:Bacteriophage protein Gp49 n=3 Tax=Burkholderia pseudomallei TaxID=28450 RepID=Q63NA1_BURPS|nr:bacteriophage protein Gp49 [Burkholderia pseudomallei]APZ22496.1 hypothetical protein BGI47_28420 [Burkholderia pseudomallei]APZ28694.1 hypothetical protein BGI46_28415 [Burkholderia pseudomallei]AYE30597.1 bacteriophage protein Gp49 [Burkholderia pseudomallei]AYX38923.1 bacteriophage protein Gp49 [Burkholderia pseudomallei]EIF68632.1 bacteriophage protein Gp49 [Burkholderia pseudomallei 354e]